MNRISEIWLRVLIAIVFFKLLVERAAREVIIRVILLKTNKTSKAPSLISVLSRMSNTTPAATRVEEWTRALTGVGAAIASGSHEENGYTPLLVEAPAISNDILTLATKYPRLVLVR